jgi:hypothetical protein
MPRDQTPTRKVLQNAAPSKSKLNGRDMGLDPRIIHMVDFLDRAIRTQNPTVGTVIAAMGVLLGRKGMDPDNLERLINDVNSAIRVGFFLHQTKGQ